MKKPQIQIEQNKLVINREAPNSPSILQRWIPRFSNRLGEAKSILYPGNPTSTTCIFQDIEARQMGPNEVEYK